MVRPSPLPQIATIPELESSGSEDLVSNEPAYWQPSLPKKRKNSSKTASQPTSKRAKPTPNPVASSSRANAVAGPSNGQVPSRRRLKSPSSRATAPSNGIAPRASQNGSKKAHSLSVRTQSNSAALTKPIRRTQKEKNRQQDKSSDSDSLPDPSQLASQVLKPVPSASAPAPKRRQSLRYGFVGHPTQSAPVKPKTKTSVIEIDDSSEEEPKVHVKPVIADSGIIDVPDTDSETEVRRKSAARKAQKRKGIKTGPPENLDPIIIIIDSDDESAPPMVLPKEEDAHQASKQLSALPPLPDPDEEEMNMNNDDGMNFGGEDVAGRGLGPSNMPADSISGTHPPAVQNSSPVVAPVSPGSNIRDLAEGPSQSQRNGNAVSNPPVTHTPDLQRAVGTFPVPDVGGENLPLSEDKAMKKQPPPVSITTDRPAPTSPSAVRDQSSTPELSEVVQSGVNVSDEPSPIPLQTDNVQGTSQNAPRFPTPPPAPSVPEVMPSKPQSQRKEPPALARPTLLVEPKNGPIAFHRSALASPYKGIRDKALSTSPATLQQNLGLLPRLDLRFPTAAKYPLPKKRLPQSQTTTPQAVPLDSRASTAAPPEQSTGPLEGRPMSPPSLQPKKIQAVTSKQLPWNQRSLVDAIITTGQHNAQSTSALLRSGPPRRLLPHPPLDPPADRRRPASPSHITPKLEEPPSGSSSSLINDIIDLTLSDDEADAIRVPVPVVKPPLNPFPRGPEESNEDVRQKTAKRLANLMANLRSVSDPTAGRSRNARSPTAKSPPLVKILSLAESAHGDMDVDGPTGDLAQVLNGGIVPTTTDHDFQRSPSLIQLPAEDAVEMDVDSNVRIAPQPDVHLAPGGLDVVSTSPTVAGSALAGWPEETSAEEETPASMGEQEIVDPALPQQPDEGSGDPSGQGIDNHPPPAVAESLERRSYDDTEVYYLEYFGPRADAFPVFNSREDPVEDLGAPITATRGDMDTNVEAECAFNDSSSSASGSVPSETEKDFLEASGDEEESASSKPVLRRSSRRSSRSSSSDPLDMLGHEYEENLDFDTPSSPLSAGNNGIHVDLDAPMSPMSPEMPDTWLSSVKIKNETVYPILTWDTYRQDASNFQIPAYYSRDLVSLLHDYINALDENFRASPHMRQVLESAIRENTAEDEPDAPLIDVVNDVDGEPTPPWEFYYTNKIWLGEDIDPSDMEDLVGCDCKGPCDPKSTTCSCLKQQMSYIKNFATPGFAYDNKGHLRTPGIPIFECNARCSCDDDVCKNRVVQHGRKCSVTIKKTLDKGWGVFAKKKISKGTYIGMYSGEFLRDDVSERRGLVYDKSGRTYLLDIDFYYMDETNYVVDAYHAGNFTRFLNNSCDPNCKVVPCYINEPNIEKPLLTLFAKRDVAAGEELCFSYQGYDPDDLDEAEVQDKAHSIVNKCLCGAARCTGFMFG